jgi:hypothetical protein
MCPLLAIEPVDVIYSYLAFKSLSEIGRCLVNMKILAPKIGAQNGDLIAGDNKRCAHISVS